MNTESYILASSIMGLASIAMLFIERKDIKTLTKEQLKKYTIITVLFYLFTIVFSYICSMFHLKTTNGISLDDMNASFSYMFFYIAIFTPILEEFIFRFCSFKFMYFLAGPNMNEKVKNYTAIVVSAFLFSVIHQGGLPQNIYAFIMGLLFGTVYTKEKNILATMYMHCIFNSITLFLYGLAILI